MTAGNCQWLICFNLNLLVSDQNDHDKSIDKYDIYQYYKWLEPVKIYKYQDAIPFVKAIHFEKFQ